MRKQGLLRAVDYDSGSCYPSRVLLDHLGHSRLHAKGRILGDLTGGHPG